MSGASPHPLRSRSASSPRWFATFERIVDAITWVATALSAAGVLAALAFVAYGVVMRYVFNAAPTWVDDTVGYMLVGIVMLAAAATLRQGAHINVDIMTGDLKGTRRRAADAWSMLAVLVFAAVLIVNGVQTAMFARSLGLNTTGNVEVPVFWLQLLMPIGGMLLLLAAIEGLLRVALGLPLPHERHLENVE
ncbi:MAG TPA: TRAP transporter small permease [Casimicrobiaceae bacterium]|nr:TRAP transporter small permease [Casimicrobiaceae bacterium]